MAKITPAPWKEFEKFLLFIGCTFERQKGSHRIYSKPGLPRPIVVPTYKVLPAFVVKNNLRLLELSQQQYREIRSGYENPDTRSATTWTSIPPKPRWPRDDTEMARAG